MAKGFDVLHIKSAVKSRNKFDLSRTHLTTMDFGEIMPLFVEETVPGDKFSVGANFFSRLAPLVKPTYGKFAFKTVSAFVPYHQIASDADAWISGKTAFEGLTPHQRYITADDIFNFLYYNCLVTTNVANSSEFTYLNGSGTTTYNVFTDKGKYYVKVLNALGYALPSNVDLQSSSYWTSTLSKMKFSAYPLLAFFKLYNDYMSQSQRFNTSALSAFLKNVRYGLSATGWNNSTGNITNVGMKTLFDNLKLNYENDYFISAWQTANNAINSIDTISSAPVPANQATEQVQYTAGNVYLNSTDLVSGQLHQRALDFLKSFDDWVRRNSYSGSRSVQQVYSRFGIKVEDFRCDYAHIVSTDSVPVQVGDVTAMADASNVPLGDYAGKGIMSGNKGISYDCEDYGCLFILGYFTVYPMNPYGHDRRVLRNQPLDYYTPEFDGIGADAISAGELMTNPIAASTDVIQDNSVFGFTERYNAYRYGRDVITGEFRSAQPASDMNVWHTGRYLNALRASGDMVAQSSSMNCLEQTSSQYNRIFSDDGSVSNVDHFYLTAHFDVSAVRPMLNLNQVVNLGEGDTSVPRNGNVIA